MNSVTHQIRKQVVEIEYPDAQESFALQERISNVYYNHLLPQMEQLFDQYAGENRLMRFEKLQLELTLSAKNWEEDLVRQVIKQLNLVLSESSVEPITLIGNKQSGDSDDVNKRLNLQTLRSNDGDVTEILITFLQTGSIPWYTNITLVELEISIIKFLQEIDGQKSQRFTDHLKSVVQTSSTAIRRLIYQFSYGLLLNLFQQERSYQILMSCLPDEMNLFTYTQLPSYKVAFWTAVINNSLNPLTEKNADEVVIKTFCDNLSLNELRILEGLTFVKKHQLLSKHLQERASYLSKEHLTKPKPVNEPQPQTDTNIFKPIGFQDEATETRGNHEQEFYVENAGLVLLQSFFVPYWEAVGLWENEYFENEQAHQRAVLLTQFMVFPKSQIAEADLLLNKILCGYPLEETLMNNLEISAAEEQEMVEVFEHINQHWKMHGTQVNTSIDNLRTAFLQRAGKLSRKEKGWLLQVEQRSFDLVLNSYPWSFGIIKNRLMKEILWVEWV